jgi:uncharacterized protein YnzC (UPF0291/DUF896 family)
MTHEDYLKAANHWKVVDAKGKAMEPEKLKQAVETYIKANKEN